jgi:retinol dehydrogenase-12
MPLRRIGTFSQLVPPKATWTTENVPDQTGKVAIITGGHVGVGKETARVRLSFSPGALLADLCLS